jgi:hypothetical protein
LLRLLHMTRQAWVNKYVEKEEQDRLYLLRMSFRLQIQSIYKPLDIHTEKLQLLFYSLL